VLRPLAASPSAPRRVRHDLATALALSGDQAGAASLLRPDLTAEQMPLALAGYAALHTP
jgi:Flp pilus assembly protein TadD